MELGQDLPWTWHEGRHSASILFFLSDIPVSHMPPMLHHWVDVDDRWCYDGQDAESALPWIARHIIF
ncbi:hypothetical protein M422DRAFT_25591 [Sphaerobolus stellatus SS14]|nr:hypothetical protein M422DRAFT_25591 [Sphaerobolus stellatus SS14]